MPIANLLKNNCVSGALEKLLSFRGFIPLSRITYCAYLLNPVAVNIIYLAGESPSEASLAEIVSLLHKTMETVTVMYFFPGSCRMRNDTNFFLHGVPFLCDGRVPIHIINENGFRQNVVQEFPTGIEDTDLI